MRNGNQQQVSELQQSQVVLTVPMRNGNFVVNNWYDVDYGGSYRTYEEWKLYNFLNIPIINNGSYRTYEEWKPQNSAISPIYASDGSYRTYEEWKRRLGICFFLVLLMFLPYL